MPVRLSRFLSAGLLLAATLVMLTVSFDAEARRFGGGRSFGRQSLNVTKQRQAVTPPAAGTAKAGTAGAAAATGARSGMSRWLGPIAGIAAGLGIAALLSSLGLSGAFLQMMSSLVLIGLVVAAIVFLVRRLQRGAAAQYARAGNGAGPQGGGQAPYSGPFARESTQRGGHGASGADARAGYGPGAESGAAPAFTATRAASPASANDTGWFVPSDFNTSAFLEQAKLQFRTIQGLWDSGDAKQLAHYLTDDLLAELDRSSPRQAEGQTTEITLLNAELLGIEAVSDGHLASVRYSGFLREEADQPAARFEEVWNLYKARDSGWLLAGIQQIPVDQTH
jgi:predicted lipid-binding transport protein (Tim44 family)